MSAHLYPCGQIVTFADRRFLGSAWSGDFVVVRHLPSGNEFPCYEIKSTGEVYSRVAHERRLTTSFTIFR